MVQATPIPLEKLDDRRLIRRFQREQDEEAFAQLVQRHGPMVYRVCRKSLASEQDAEDAYQAVFMVLARKAGRVRWEKCLAKWLYGVALRICLKARSNMQNRPREHRLENNLIQELAEGNSSTPEWSGEAERILYEEIERLPANLQEPILLCSLEGRSRQEAAEALGVRESTLKGRLERARELLKTRMLRREIVLPAAVLTGGLIPTAAEAGFSTSLIFSPTAVATNLSTGTAVSGQLGISAFKLAQGELATMLMMTKLKVAVVSLSLVLLLGGGSCYVFQESTESSPSTETADQFDHMKPVNEVTMTEEEFRQNLTGLWEVTDFYEEVGSPAMPPGYEIDLSFTKEKMVMLIHEPGETGKRTRDTLMEFQLQFNQVPVGIDLSTIVRDIGSSEEKVAKFLGIIDIREGVLRLQFNKSSEVRPEAFTKSGMFVAKKVKSEVE